MDRPRLIRGLRIAWSVVFGILCVLLICLWVRSNGRWERFYIGITDSVGMVFQSGNCQLRFVWENFWDEPTVRLMRWAYYSEPRDVNPSPGFGGFQYSGYEHIKNARHFAAPHWFALIICGLAGVTPWLPWRFSLRTLLIATTLIAVVLGLVVWAMR
jgi:hypothetical protein